jgi:hypothetical protein
VVRLKRKQVQEEELSKVRSTGPAANVSEHVTHNRLQHAFLVSLGDLVAQFDSIGTY